MSSSLRPFRRRRPRFAYRQSGGLRRRPSRHGPIWAAPSRTQGSETTAHGAPTLSRWQSPAADPATDAAGSRFRSPSCGQRLDDGETRPLAALAQAVRRAGAGRRAAGEERRGLAARHRLAAVRREVLDEESTPDAVAVRDRGPIRLGRGATEHVSTEHEPWPRRRTQQSGAKENYYGSNRLISRGLGIES